MAATISDLANGVSTTDDTACATGATVTASVGDWLVIIAASANSETGGAASISGVVDSDGINTYTQRALINYDPAAASAGATLGIFTCEVTSALSGDTITVNHSVNTPQKAVQVYKLVPGASETISFIEADTTGSVDNATTHSAATVSVTSGDIIFGAASIETDDAITGDSDTTNGNWSTIITRLADGGADASTMSCSSQYKTTTGTGNQDWACTTATGRDSARSYLVLRSAIELAAYEINAEPGSYGVTGAALTVLADRLINLAPGGYSLTGLDAALSRGFEINAEPGTYLLDGISASLLADRLINAEPGTYILDGPAATLARGYFIVAESGSYIVTGAAAQLLKGYAIDAGPGEYVITGQAATLLADRLLNLESGDYEILGPDATLVYAPVGAYELNCEPGVYEITGIAATVLTDRLINVEPGTYTLNGSDANLTSTSTPHGACLYWFLRKNVGLA